MARCKSCGEEIAFVRTRAGKWMPVNGTEPETYYLFLNDQGEPHMMVVLEDGTCILGRIGKATDNGVCKLRGYESHFATCSQAEQHRQRY